jgi:hypothetical protein
VLEIDPTAGLSDQVTAAFIVPVTAAVNCCDCEAANETAEGVIVMLTAGVSETLAVADLVGSAALMALTTTV